MGQAVTIRVQNARALRAALKRAGEDLAEMKDANAQAAAFVATRAAANAPRRSGRLASTVRGNRAASRARVSAGGAAVPYAAPIHWGWPARGIEAQPWISETAHQTEPAWLGLYQKDIERILDRVERST